MSILAIVVTAAVALALALIWLAGWKGFAAGQQRGYMTAVKEIHKARGYMSVSSNIADRIELPGMDRAAIVLSSSPFARSLLKDSRATVTDAPH